VGVRLGQPLLELAIHAAVTHGGRALRLVAERALIDLSIAALAPFFGGGVAHFSFSNAAATSFCRSRPTSRPSEVVIGELSSL
jgi:hypothetical protein